MDKRQTYLGPEMRLCFEYREELCSIMLGIMSIERNHCVHKCESFDTLFVTNNLML